MRIRMLLYDALVYPLKVWSYMEFSSFEELQEFFSHDEFATKCLGAHVVSYDKETGAATVAMTIDDRHHNAQGYVMGGVLFALCDFALAVATNVGQEPSSSVAHSIQFMRRAKTDELRAVAKPDKLGSTLAFFTVDVFDGFDRHLCRMTATCMRTDH
ncbi:MAG: PaaI family thioesterase [Coriobacteriales bacterium]|jgi:acyl-CoA thioesterase